MFDAARHHRRSIRLKGYDYSQPGMYFVTVVTQERACLFGEISRGEMQLDEAGRMIARQWQSIPSRFAHASIDAFVIMPNHIHGIVIIMKAVWAGSSRPSGAADPPIGEAGAMTAPLPETLGQIMAYFKYQSTKSFNALRGARVGRIWQHSCYEHIIRTGRSLDLVREYVTTNPAAWEHDRENPVATEFDEQEPWMERIQ